MNEELVIVFKDKKNREISTYVSVAGHGARMSVKDFVRAMSDFYGSPATTITKKGHESALLLAAEKAIYQMKSQTREVAAVNLEPPIYE